jgi:hypothetical protein
MTLTVLLGIDRRFLTCEDELGLAYAERLFVAAGAPTRNRALYDLLEQILVACKREGLVYPPILLLRKKQIGRGVWSPQLPQAKPSPAEYDARKEELQRQAIQIQKEEAAPQELPGPRSVPRKKTA